MSPKTRIASRVVAITLFLLHGSVQAENMLSVYTGTSMTRDSDVRIAQPASGTALTVRDVEWGADPFRPAPYYGVRFTHFYDEAPNWGAAIDFTHYKMYAKTTRATPVQGAWRGASVDAVSRMDAYVQRFDISHGVNVLSINGIYRWLDLPVARGKLQPYAGIGLAYYRPHAENTVDNLPHESGYRDSGFGYQLFGGLHYRFTERIGAFVEAKFNSGTAKVSIANGDAETPLRTFHAVAGASFSF